MKVVDELEFAVAFVVTSDRTVRPSGRGPRGLLAHAPLAAGAASPRAAPCPVLSVASSCCWKGMRAYQMHRLALSYSFTLSVSLPHHVPPRLWSSLTPTDSYPEVCSTIASRVSCSHIHPVSPAFQGPTASAGNRTAASPAPAAQMGGHRCPPQGLCG